MTSRPSLSGSVARMPWPSQRRQPRPELRGIGGARCGTVQIARDQLRTGFGKLQTASVTASPRAIAVPASCDC